MKTALFLDVTPCGLVPKVSDERIASIFKAEKIDRAGSSETLETFYQTTRYHISAIEQDG
jgi:hypothetical protein